MKKLAMILTSLALALGLTACSGTGRNAKKYYYRCSNAKRKKDRKRHTVRKADIEETKIRTHSLLVMCSDFVVSI